MDRFELETVRHSVSEDGRGYSHGITSRRPKGSMICYVVNEPAGKTRIREPGRAKITTEASCSKLAQWTLAYARGWYGSHAAPCAAWPDLFHSSKNGLNRITWRNSRP